MSYRRSMRTTLNVDEDVLAAGTARARQEGRTVGEVISEIVRRELARTPQPAVGSRNDVPVLTGHRESVTDDLVDQLREEAGL